MTHVLRQLKSTVAREPGSPGGMLLALACLAALLMAGIPPTVGRGAAQEMTPFVPDPADCRVAPRADLTRATPAAGVTPTPIPQGTVDQLPQGEPASPKIVAAVLAFELEFAACYNAGDLRRVAALMTDEAVVPFLELMDDPEFGPRFATPKPVPRRWGAPYVAVREVRLLPDGRAGAIVDWGPDATVFRYYESVDGRWLLDGQIHIIGWMDSIPPPETPAP